MERQVAIVLISRFCRWVASTGLPTPQRSMTIATFISPMLLLRREKLPEGPEWRYELKPKFLPSTTRL